MFKVKNVEGGCILVGFSEVQSRESKSDEKVTV